MPGAQGVDGVRGMNNEEAEVEEGKITWAFLGMSIMESPQKTEAGTAVSG